MTWCTGLALVGALAGSGQSAAAVQAAAGSWRRAIEVPGLGALNKGEAEVDSVSCGSAGNCVAGGSYRGRHHRQGFVAVERRGVWRRAIEVPGLGTLNQGRKVYGTVGVVSVSCASAGNCAVAGDYQDRAGKEQGFVAVEKNGVWGKAIEVPGLGALNKGGYAEVDSVSCASAGNCAAGGGYEDPAQDEQGFVAVEKNGRWGKAIDPPGLKALNGSSGSPNAEVDSMSCASAGNCAAVGTYGDPYGTGFVVTENKGVWGKATDVGLIGGRIAGANSVSCASAGNCAAGGFYSDSSGGVTQGWVAVERHGRWNNGTKVPGLVALNKGGDAAVYSVSCPAAGRCAAGGYYTGRHQHSQGFVVNRTG